MCVSVRACAYFIVTPQNPLQPNLNCNKTERRISVLDSCSPWMCLQYLKNWKRKKVSGTVIERNGIHICIYEFLCFALVYVFFFPEVSNLKSKLNHRLIRNLVFLISGFFWAQLFFRLRLLVTEVAAVSLVVLATYHPKCPHFLPFSREGKRFRILTCIFHALGV